MDGGGWKPLEEERDKENQQGTILQSSWSMGVLTGFRISLHFFQNQEAFSSLNTHMRGEGGKHWHIRIQKRVRQQFGHILGGKKGKSHCISFFIISI